MVRIGYRYTLGALAIALCIPYIASAAVCPYAWNANLSSGKSGLDVLKLQQFLNQDPRTLVAASGPGSPGLETDVFAGLTKKAVIAFQELYAADILTPNGLSAGNGFVGVATRAKLAKLCSAAASTQQSSLAAAALAGTPGLQLSVPEQPAATLALSGALYVPFTDFTLTAGAVDVTVRSVTIERVGPASDAVLLDIDLFDDQGNFLGIAYFTSDDRAVFRKPFVIPAGTSVTLSVVGDMALDLTGHDGEMAALQVIEIDASTPLTGQLPVRGTLQTMNSTIAIGVATVSLGADDPRVARTRYINDKDVLFSSIRVAANSTEDQKLTWFAWRQNGTSGPSDIENVRIVVNDQSFPAERDERSYFAALGDGILIPKSTYVTVSVRGDLLVAGANRTVQFDIHDGGDIALEGTTYGFGIFPIPEGDTNIAGSNSAFITEDGSPDTASLRPYFAGSPVTITGGTATFIGR